MVFFVAGLQATSGTPQTLGWSATANPDPGKAEADGELEYAMTTRTTQKTVTFARPFRLGEFGELLPAGSYPIETDEELVEGVSFPVYRRTTTMIQLIADPHRQGTMETMVVDPLQLEAALAKDMEHAPEAGEITVVSATVAP